MRFSTDLTRRGAAVALAGALALGAAACGEDTPMRPALVPR